MAKLRIFRESLSTTTLRASKFDETRRSDRIGAEIVPGSFVPATGEPFIPAVCSHTRIFSSTPFWPPTFPQIVRSIYYCADDDVGGVPVTPDDFFEKSVDAGNNYLPYSRDHRRTRPRWSRVFFVVYTSPRFVYGSIFGEQPRGALFDSPGARESVTAELNDSSKRICRTPRYTYTHTYIYIH